MSHMADMFQMVGGPQVRQTTAQSISIICMHNKI